MGTEKIRNSFLYKNYFDEFFSKQKTKVKEKIIWTINLIETLQNIPEDYFKHLTNTNGLYEIRVKQGSDIFRICAFFDKDKLVILTNGF